MGEQRIEAWDYLRLIAFIDIACLHLINTHLFFGVGLPAFVVITCALALTSSASSIAQLANVRVKRLFVPWLFWSVVLGAQIAFAQVRHGAPVLDGFEPSMVFYGTGQHLWFLPYAAVAGISVYWLHKRLAHVPTEKLIVGCMIATAALALTQDCSTTLDLPFQQWLFASPGIPLGLALGRVLAKHRNQADGWRVQALLTIAMLVTATVVLALPWIGENTDIVMRRYTLAFTLLMAVTFIKQPRTVFMKHVRPTLFGAYVLHPLVGFQLMRFTQNKLALVSATVVLTLGLVMGLRRTALRTVL
ncbi:MAG: acyltransferase family protein [Polyangiales bacterium]